MFKLSNYVGGEWINGDGEGQTQFSAITGHAISNTSTSGIDMQAAVDFARKTGNPHMRNLTFHQRGKMLKAVANHLKKYLMKFYKLSAQTGATKTDSWIDIEGGIATMLTYASLRRQFADETFTTDGEGINLGKNHTFMGHHILVPKEGVAVHINAFNFPVFMMLEKCAVNWMAGVPAIVKPGTITSFLAHAVAEEIINSGILPPGALQLICGDAGDLLQHLTSQDVVNFTGSHATGLLLKSNPHLQAESVMFNMEADSLNCIVLGEDVKPGMPEFEIFIKEIRNEITIKAGQKCTAIRRIIVPETMLEVVCKFLYKALHQTFVGNPLNERVHMGALASEGQRTEVKEQVQKLLATSQIIYGSLDSVEVIDASPEIGAFMSPLLLLNQQPFRSAAVHEVEVFGPVSTVMPYKTLDEAIALSKMGKGSLCSSIVTANDRIAKQYVLGAGTHHGRILILNKDCAKESTGTGIALPMLTHGGPGRAGGGEELGGVRGIKKYMQRVAIQGSPTTITAVTNVYQPHAAGKSNDEHLFTKYFDELQIGDQMITEKKMITAEDVNLFADLTGDHFYAHNSATDFTKTMFQKQVAHGYFIMGVAAGLFVLSHEHNPVLLNYGIDELRFTKPVYPGTEIYVKISCREKIPYDTKPGEIPKGIVKWNVEIYDDANDQVGFAIVLTMVARKEAV